MHICVMPYALAWPRENHNARVATGKMCVLLQAHAWPAESEKGFVHLREYHRALEEAKEKPWQLVLELMNACRAVQYPSGQAWPLTRLCLTLEPASDSPHETRGTLVFKVRSLLRNW